MRGGGVVADLRRRQVDRDDDPGHLALPVGLAQCPPDGLDDVDDARLRVREADGVHGGDVDALRQEPTVAEDAALLAVLAGVGLEVGERGPAVLEPVGAGHRLRPDPLRPLRVLQQLRGPQQSARELPRPSHPRVERDDPAQAEVGDRAQHRDLQREAQQFLVAALGAQVGDGGEVEQLAQVLVRHYRHEYPVVGEVAVLDPLSEGPGETGLAVDLLRVHGAERGQLLGTLGVGEVGQAVLRAPVVRDPGRGGEVQPALRRNLGVVVDRGPRLPLRTGRAVGLVDDHEVPLGQPPALVGLDDPLQRGVGGVHGDRLVVGGTVDQVGDPGRLCGHLGVDAAAGLGALQCLLAGARRHRQAPAPAPQ